MSVTKNKIANNLRRIRRDIAAACDRAGRSHDEVSILAVTKAVDSATIMNLLDCGLNELGESRVAQLIQRAAEIDALLKRRRNGPDKPPRWHLIGHLQRNKARHALEVTGVIHSLDSLRLAEEIDKWADRTDRVVDVFLQVNCSGESQKFGCAVGAATHLAELICTLRGLRLVGLMTMAPLTSDPEQARPTFVRLREIFEEMRREKIGGEEMRHLSMGMSQDYAVAVEEGATILRIGTALFE